jgi:hypothetical protein
LQSPFSDQLCDNGSRERDQTAGRWLHFAFDIVLSLPDNNQRHLKQGSSTNGKTGEDGSSGEEVWD